MTEKKVNLPCFDCSSLLPGISGYVSANFYKKIGGTNWVWNVVLTTSIFSGNL